MHFSLGLGLSFVCETGINRSEPVTCMWLTSLHLWMVYGRQRKSADGLGFHEVALKPVNTAL